MTIKEPRTINGEADKTDEEVQSVLEEKMRVLANLLIDRLLDDIKSGTKELLISQERNKVDYGTTKDGDKS